MIPRSLATALIVLAGTIAFAHYLSLIVRRFLIDRTPKHFFTNRSLISLCSRLTLYAVYGIGISMSLSILGFGVSALIPASVVGLALTLPATAFITAFFNGAALIISGDIQIGDHFKLSDGTEVIVQDVKLRSTHFLTTDGEYRIKPNSELATEELVVITRGGLNANGSNG